MDSRIIPKVKHLCRSFIWFLSSITVAGFSVGGTEVVAVTAGESDNPENYAKGC